ncbi:ARL14 effector protein isoform X3 [Gadus chalcogrammus]|uniref:ARL14 effector protein isoform X3 n=1 Tax=Gadus chalcogrammus TaxID=1042646 RepID=UPI0024C4C4F9|nr:ARL14 effector protein isoform X3 [Gadus chalcogrammus]
MPVICAAIGCNNKFVKGSEIRFYRFPLSKPQLANQWVHSLGMKNFLPTANTCLCSEHFRPDCFRDYNGKQFLREDAVPTIFTAGHDSTKSLQIELRKRGVVTKDTNPAARPATQTGERTRDGANLRREKRGAVRGGRGGRGGKYSTNERQTMGPKSKLYDAKGVLISSGKDMCDCLDVDCMGCFYPCPDCGARKCGVECRCHRKWLYEQVEVEGGEIIRNKFAV